MCNTVVSHTNILASVFRFTADVTYLNSRCVESSPVPLNNLFWKVKICKSNNEPFVAVDVSLFAYSDHAFSRWESEAQATVRLLPIDTRVHPASKQLSITKFTSSHPEHTIQSIVSWNDFYANYVKENRATFEIALSAGPSATSSSSMVRRETSDIEVIKSRLHIMLENADQFGRTETSEVTVRGIKWRVVVETKPTGVLVHLVANEEYLGRGDTYSVDATAKIFTYDRNASPYVASFNHVYQRDANTGGLNHFISWNDFIYSNRKFILDGKANLLVEFKVDTPRVFSIINENPIQF